MSAMKYLLILCDELTICGAWVEACLTEAMGVDPRLGTELPLTVEYRPKNMVDHI